MLFQIIKAGFDGKSFSHDPKRFTEGVVKQTALSFLIAPVITAVLFLTLLFVLSFTHILGGPFWLARVFFWMLAIGYAFVSIPVYLFYKMVKRASKIAGTKTEQIFVKAEIKE
jgi:cell shape-determining protein MreC